MSSPANLTSDATPAPTIATPATPSLATVTSAGSVPMPLDEVQRLLEAKLTELAIQKKAAAVAAASSSSKRRAARNTEIITDDDIYRAALLPPDEQALAARQSELTAQLRSIAAPAAVANPDALSAFAEQLVRSCVGAERVAVGRLRLMERCLTEEQSRVAELGRATDRNGKLENLCRELQKQNKDTLEASKRNAEQELMKRKELTENFQKALTDFSQKLEAFSDERKGQAEENTQLKMKLMTILEQYEVREQFFEKLKASRDAERAELENQIEAQKKIAMVEAEKSNLLSAQVKALSTTEADLRTQLASYSQKFEQFHSTLTKSNEVFATFKSEMDKMSKNMKKLEKENAELKKKKETTDLALFDLFSEKKKLDEELLRRDAKIERLEKLCRALHQEQKAKSAAVASTAETKTDDPAAAAAESSAGGEASSVVETAATDAAPVPAPAS